MRSCILDAWRMLKGAASRRALLGLAVIVLALLVPVVGAQAETLTVTSTEDPASSTCLPGSCTLRAAIAKANEDGLNDTIQIPPGAYQLAQASGQLVITASMTLAGSGATSTKILAAEYTQLIKVGGSGEVTLADLKLEGADVTEEGAALQALGGASASITIKRAIIANNESKGPNDGAGVYDLSTGPLLIEASTLSHNVAQGGGAVDGTAPITVINSTLTGNAARNDGGAIEVGNIKLINDTITGNSCGNGSGCGGGINGINLTPFAVRSKDTIIAGNTDGTGSINNCLASGGGATLENTFKAEGPNLENASDCNFKASGGVEGDPLLGPLGEYGGPTPTMIPGAGSPAIDAGKECAAQDQRGHTRPTPAGPCDIGAIEADAPTVTSITPSSGATAGGVPVTINGTGFLSGATVTIGSAATSVSVISETEIKATTSAHPAGPTEVVVADASGTSTGGPAYTYVNPVSVAGNALLAGGPPNVPLASVTPVISHLTISPTRFAVGRAPTALTASAHPLRGTTISFALNEPATVHILMRRQLSGHRNGGRCLAAAAGERVRKGTRCTRLVPVGTLTRTGASGANRVAFSGRVGSHPLQPGTYVVTLTADVPGAPASTPARAAFTVVR